ncbi:MAG: C1 family peptidase, partial [Lachnospiraceae bacterium]|nr:C1 family peptidase [Lachnospiraceae bacterium]
MRLRSVCAKTLSMILSLTLVIQSGQTSITVRAEGKTEQAQTTDSGLIYDEADADPIFRADDAKQDTALQYIDIEHEEMKAATGYIEMPWDSDVSEADPDMDYNEALEKMVEGSDEGSADGGAYKPGNDRYVQQPVSIEAKFPAYTSESQILEYLRQRYPATRSQSPYGSCWAHSAVSLAEFYMINHGLSDSEGLVGNDVNYSELQLAYFCYHQTPDNVTGDTEDRITYDNNAGEKKSFLDFGGNLNFAAQSLMRFNGVVNDEDDAAYSNAAAVLANGLDETYARSMDAAHLKNEYVLNIKTNPDLVKQAIKENGIVGVSIYADDKYFNESTNAFYNNVEDSSNHAVAIVGWDDTYPVSSFLSGRRPTGPGAWLVRNSW